MYLHEWNVCKVNETSSVVLACWTLYCHTRKAVNNQIIFKRAIHLCDSNNER